MTPAALSRRTLLAAGALALAGRSGPAAAMGAITRRLVIGEGSVAYLRAGQGPALVILPGIGGRKEDWMGTVFALFAERTVLALDMPGFGSSSREGLDLSVPAQAACVKAVLDREGAASADLIGHGLGGWVAAHLAATFPDRVRKLALIAPAGLGGMFRGDPPAKLFPDTVEEMQTLLERLRHAPVAEATAAQAFAAFDASRERSVAPRLLPALAASPHLEAVMPQIKAPTLVMWGAEDRLFPSSLAPVVAGLTPGATAALVAAAGHAPHVDQREAFNALLTRFILG